MASQRCRTILIDSKEFGALDVAAQRERLTHFIADWFDPGHRPDTVDHVRFTARLRTHAVQSKISVGEVMEIILPAARKQHATAVYDAEAARIREKDLASNDPKTAQPSTDEPVVADQEPVPYRASKPVAQTIRARSRSKPRSATAK